MTRNETSEMATMALYRAQGIILRRRCFNSVLIVVFPLSPPFAPIAFRVLPPGKLYDINRQDRFMIKLFTLKEVKSLYGIARSSIVLATTRDTCRLYIQTVSIRNILVIIEFSQLDLVYKVIRCAPPMSAGIS